MVTWGSAIRSRGRGACPLTPLNWNPHSLLQINPNPTPLPSTQLTLVYNTYVYPPREEERDSKMDGFKLGVFYSEARINRSTGELLLYDWSNTKSRLDPDSGQSRDIFRDPVKKNHPECFKRLPADTRSLTMAPATRFSGSPLSSSGGSWFEINTPKLGLPAPIYKSGSI